MTIDHKGSTCRPITLFGDVVNRDMTEFKSRPLGGKREPRITWPNVHSFTKVRWRSTTVPRSFRNRQLLTQNTASLPEVLNASKHNMRLTCTRYF